MKLALFDFDDTLFKTPYDENWGYMDTPQSLDLSKWKFEVNDDVMEDYTNQYVNRRLGKTKVILLTNRISDVENALRTLLDSRLVFFDEYLPIVGKDGNRSKGQRVLELLKKYPHVTEIEYWEDKDKHIIDVLNVLTDFPKITVKINKVPT
tara:strand:+ start:18 stop:470 length:453 start_codon:yes stop_codon:yes gene_type:complete